MSDWNTEYNKEYKESEDLAESTKNPDESEVYDILNGLDLDCLDIAINRLRFIHGDAANEKSQHDLLTLKSKLLSLMELYN